MSLFYKGIRITDNNPDWSTNKMPRNDVDHSTSVGDEGNEVKEKMAVSKHQEETHSGKKAYTCNHCKKCFSSLSSRIRHERTHRGVKPYTCKYCNKCFNTSSECKSHERTHTGVSECKSHERTHTGVKPYTCKQCNKRFSRSSQCKVDGGTKRKKEL
ncbi:hypothetical protein ACROYT_G018549 [Oculina patagonica]